MRFGMENANPVKNPASTCVKLDDLSVEEDKPADVPYQEAIGALLYVVQGTRPDIAYIVGALSRYNQNPKIGHWNAVKRVYRYLKGTMNYSIKYTKDGVLYGYTDSDYASDKDRKSISGNVFLMNGGPVSWCSRKQKIVAMSSTEAEYVALGAAVQEALWLKQIIQEVEGDTQTVKIYCDNKSTINLSEQEVLQQRTKHIDIRYKFVKHYVSENSIKLQFVGTNENIADIFTKPTTAEKFFSMCEKMHLNYN